MNFSAVLPDSGDIQGVELVNIGYINRYTDPACLGVDTEWCLQQMLNTFCDCYVKSGIAELQHHFFHEELAFVGLDKNISYISQEVKVQLQGCFVQCCVTYGKRKWWEFRQVRWCPYHSHKWCLALCTKQKTLNLFVWYTKTWWQFSSYKHCK